MTGELIREANRFRADVVVRLFGAGFAFTAGSIDSIGLMATGRFTSHMSGTTSTTARALVRGNLGLAALGGCALLSFVAGATLSGYLTAGSEQSMATTRLRTMLVLELLMIAGGVAVAAVSIDGHVCAFLLIACFASAMGFQNNLSKRGLSLGVRSTHVTGILTDLGSGIGGYLFAAGRRSDDIDSFVTRLAKSATLFIAFALGGIACGFGFLQVGLIASAIPMLVIVSMILMTSHRESI